MESGVWLFVGSERAIMKGFERKVAKRMEDISRRAAAKVASVQKKREASAVEQSKHLKAELDDSASAQAELERMLAAVTSQHVAALAKLGAYEMCEAECLSSRRSGEPMRYFGPEELMPEPRPPRAVALEADALGEALVLARATTGCFHCTST